MKGRRGRGHIRPEEVRSSDAKRILAALNAAKTARELADAIEISGERKEAIKVAQKILDRREELGRFTDLRQVEELPEVGPERFTSLVTALGAKRPRARAREGEEGAREPASGGACVEGASPRGKPSGYVPPLVYPFGAPMPPGWPFAEATPCVGGASPQPELPKSGGCGPGLTPGQSFFAPRSYGGDCEGGSQPYWGDCAEGTKPWIFGDCEEGSRPRGLFTDCQDGSRPSTGDCSEGSSPGW